MISTSVKVGPLTLRTPLIASSGTVGSIGEWSGVADADAYGAAVAKSVSGTPWEGRPSPRLAPVEAGMLNSIGIQNPGIDEWVRQHSGRLDSYGVPVWGSAVGHDPDEFARVADGLARCGVAGIEINLSCPNLEDGRMFALDATRAATVVAAVHGTVDIPVGAKLSPNAEDIVAVAEATLEAGADWLTLTNTAWGAGIDIERRRPLVSGVVGGYSGVGMKPLAMRCVIEVHRAFPTAPIIGLGGVRKGTDVIEYLMAGARAVGAGTVHFEDPKAGRRILREARRWAERHGVESFDELVGSGL